MGPFPLKNTQGIGISVCILIRLLGKGWYQDTLINKSIRKMRSAFSNIWYASSNTLTTIVLVRNIGKIYATSCPVYSLWFERCMVAMHKRMGDEVRQDKTVTLEVAHRMIEGLEKEFLRAKADIIRGDLCDIAIVFLFSLLAVLRGEETLKISLSKTRDYFEEARGSAKHGYIVLPLRGRFKEENREGYYFVAVRSETYSALRLGPWVERALTLKKAGENKMLFFCTEYWKRTSLKNL